jgi:hypothetical protein
VCEDKSESNEKNCSIKKYIFKNNNIDTVFKSITYDEIVLSPWRRGPRYQKIVGSNPAGG